MSRSRMAGTPSPRQRPKFSADGRAGKVDLLERALCLFAISSLLRVRTLKPRPLSPFPLTVVADSQLVCAGVLNSLIGVWHLACFAGVAGRGCCKCSSAARCWRLFFDWSACAHRAPPGKPRRCLGTCASREHASRKARMSMLSRAEACTRLREREHAWSGAIVTCAMRCTRTCAACCMSRSQCEARSCR